MEAAVNGTTLYYERDGKTGNPVCFVLHGGLGLDHHLYRSTLGPLTKQFDVVFLDFRSNGRSGRPPLESLTMEQLADDVNELANQLGIDRYYVLGHSYGGFVAQELAIQHPGQVLGLILVGTSPGQVADTEPSTEYAVYPRPEELLAIWRDAAEDDDETSEARWRAALPYFTNEDMVPLLSKEFDETIFSAAALQRSDEMYSTWSSTKRLANVSVPALLIVGTKDIIHPIGQTRRIERALPNTMAIVIEGANHFPWLDKPDEFFTAISKWLSDISE